MTESVSFFVPGPPRGKQRARSGKGRHYTPKETVEAERDIGWQAKKAMAGRQPFEGPLELGIVARYDYPASWSPKKRASIFWKTSRPDLDNIAKLVKDSLNGVVWKDDAQVVSTFQKKNYAQLEAKEGIAIEISPVHDGGTRA